MSFASRNGITEENNYQRAVCLHTHTTSYLEVKCELPAAWQNIYGLSLTQLITQSDTSKDFIGQRFAHIFF